MDEQFAEHALGREEAAISDMLNELNKDISKIHVIANKSKMIIFLHSLTYRTKKFRDQMDAINAINDKTVEFLTAICDNMELDEETKKKTIEVNCSKGKNTQLHQILVNQTEPKPEMKTSLLRKLDEKKKECAERDAKQQTVKKKRNYNMSL